MAIKALIVDDEPLAREQIAVLLEGEPDVAIIGECGDGKSAVQSIRNGHPDVVFLDIKLPEMSGFEILDSLPQELQPSIIFVTAYDRYALQAFKVHAVDYLLKPVEEQPFRVAVGELRLRLDGRGGGGVPRDNVAGLLRDLEGLRRSNGSIAFNSGNEVLCLKLSDIDWIEAAGNYVNVHAGNSAHLVDGPLSALEGRLSSHSFLRIHRSRIVNSDRIRRIKPLLYGDYTVELHDGTKLILSRSYRDAVLQKVRSR